MLPQEAQEILMSAAKEAASYTGDDIFERANRVATINKAMHRVMFNWPQFFKPQALDGE